MRLSASFPWSRRKANTKPMVYAMTARLDLGEISIDVMFKDIKNVHLSVLPPLGRVRIAAPSRMSLETLRLFAISKLEWIRRKRQKFQEQARETPRECLNRESHYLWGKRYLLTVVEKNRHASVEVTHDRLLLHVEPGASEERKREVVAQWYREQMREEIPALLATWEPFVGAAPKNFHVRRMKTKWGSCNPAARSIQLNTELAKKPRECLEYVVLHELIHLLVPTHGARFVAKLDQLMPNWRSRRDLLNELPVCHEEWKD